MSRRPIDRSPPLKRLRNEGYDVDVITGYLIIRDVPYVGKRQPVTAIRGATRSDWCEF